MLSNVLAMIRILKHKTYDLYCNYDKEKVAKRQKDDKQIYEKIYYFFTTPSEICKNDKFKIYLGSGFNAVNYNILAGLNITKVINVTEEIPNYFEEDFDYYQIKIKDNNEARLYEYFDDLITNINSSKIDKQVIYVHCYQGASRSATVVLLLMVIFMDYSIEDAKKYLDDIYPINNININFIEDLNEYLNVREENLILEKEGKKNN